MDEKLIRFFIFMETKRSGRENTQTFFRTSKFGKIQEKFLLKIKREKKKLSPVEQFLFKSFEQFVKFIWLTIKKNGIKPHSDFMLIFDG
jgi:hypothetical protein